MHQIRKLFLSLLLFPLALISCANNRVYGRYAFQMGGDKSSHFGIFVDLNKDDYIEGGVKKGQQFKFGAKLSEDMIPEFPEEYPSDSAGYIESLFIYMLIDILNVEQDSSAGLTGYYNITDKYYEDKGYKVDMNIVLDIVEVDPDILQKFIISYLKGNTMSIVLPVSVPDFQRQLCWYGTFIYFNLDAEDPEERAVIETLPEPLPGPQGDDRIGTHPSEAEVQEMNDKYGEEYFKKDGRNFEFKDFNTLTIELLKN